MSENPLVLHSTTATNTQVQLYSEARPLDQAIEQTRLCHNPRLVQSKGLEEAKERAIRAMANGTLFLLANAGTKNFPQQFVFAQTFAALRIAQMRSIHTPLTARTETIRQKVLKLIKPLTSLLAYSGGVIACKLAESVFDLLNRCKSTRPNQRYMIEPPEMEECVRKEPEVTLTSSTPRLTENKPTETREEPDSPDAAPLNTQQKTHAEKKQALIVLPSAKNKPTISNHKAIISFVTPKTSEKTFTAVPVNSNAMQIVPYGSNIVSFKPAPIQPVPTPHVDQAKEAWEHLWEQHQQNLTRQPQEKVNTEEGAFEEVDEVEEGEDLQENETYQKVVIQITDIKEKPKYDLD